jgi:cytochrome P450
LPIVGNALQLDPGRLHSRLEGWAERYGRSFLVRLGRRLVLVTSDAAIAQQVLHQRPDQFRRFRPIESVTRELEGYGLFSAEGDDWRRMRRVVLPGLNSRQVRAAHSDQVRVTRRLAAAWSRAAREGRAVDVQGDLMRYTVDVTSLVAFGRDLDTLEQPASELQAHVSVLFAAINDRVNALVPYWRYVKLPRDREVERAKSSVRRLMFEMIAEAEAALARDPSRAASPRTVLEAMLVARKHDDLGTRMTDDEVVANVATLLLAGEDTTANTLAWVLHYLAHHPAVQRRARDEVDAILGPAPILENPEDAHRLRYVAAVVHEALRLRAVLPVQFLEAADDVVLGGVAVPVGTPIFLLTRRAALDPSNFDNPLAFDPERWLQQGGDHEPTHNPRAHFAFGGGPRTCPGRALALVECAMVVSMTLRNLYVEPACAESAVGESFDFTMRPTGLRILFRERTAPRVESPRGLGERMGRGGPATREIQ